MGNALLFIEWRALYEIILLKSLVQIFNGADEADNIFCFKFGLKVGRSHISEL